MGEASIEVGNNMGRNSHPNLDSPSQVQGDNILGDEHQIKIGEEPEVLAMHARTERLHLDSRGMQPKNPKNDLKL